MLRKMFSGLRLAVLVPLFAAVAGLVAVQPAHAIHKDGLDAIGLSVTTVVDDDGNPAGLLVTDIRDGSAAAASGLDVGDVIVEVNGAAPGTAADLDNAVLNALNAGEATLDLSVIDTRDPNAGPQAVSLPLQ